VLGDFVTKESIHRNVAVRVANTMAILINRLETYSSLSLCPIDLSILSWESIFDALPNEEESLRLRELCGFCCQFNFAGDFGVVKT